MAQREVFSSQMFAQAQEAVTFFAVVFLELAVLFVGISFLVEVIRYLLPPDKIKRFLSGTRPTGYVFAAITGALTPFCSCSTIPMTTGFLRAGGGFGPVMTFLFVSPLLNPVLATLFVVNFGLDKAIVYGVLAISTAVVFGLLLQTLQFNRYLIQTQPVVTVPFPVIKNEYQKEANEKDNSTNEKDCCEPSCCSTSQTDVGVSTGKGGLWKQLFFNSAHDFMDFLPYVVLGVAIGAVAHGFVPDGLLTKYAGKDNFLAVPLAALIGVPLYVRASTMIPISMSLLGKGMSIGAVMALVIGGAGASLPEVVMLKRLFRWPLLCVFLFEVFLMAIGAGFLFNQIG
jgi:uncharacterized membrane protein YraQ (UPF0718 family)